MKTLIRSFLIVTFWLTATHVRADTIILSCYDQLRDYRITLNTKNGMLFWESSLASTQFNVRKIQRKKDGLYVWGNTKDYGNDYFLKIGMTASIKYFYGNHSQAEDPCTLVSTLTD
jgi:hypothetical protein